MPFIWQVDWLINNEFISKEFTYSYSSYKSFLTENKCHLNQDHRFLHTRVSQNQHFKLHSTNRSGDRVNVQNNKCLWQLKTFSLTVLYSFIQCFFFCFVFFTQQQKVSSDYQVNECKPNEMHIGDELFVGITNNSNRKDFFFFTDVPKWHICKIVTVDMINKEKWIINSNSYAKIM